MWKRMPVWGRMLVLIVAVLVVIAAAGGIFFAEMAGMLPGQPEATRIPITPFSDIPGLNLPTQIPTVGP